MRVTKSVWTSEPDGTRRPKAHRATTPRISSGCQSLRRAGHEIAVHDVARATSARANARRPRALSRVVRRRPARHANHSGTARRIYHGDARVTGWRARLQRVHTRPPPRRVQGARARSPHFWGDICLEHVTYVRNFVYRDINTLEVVPVYAVPRRGQALRARSGSRGPRAPSPRRSSRTWPSPTSSVSRTSRGSASCTRTSARGSSAQAASIPASSADAAMAGATAGSRRSRRSSTISAPRRASGSSAS